MENQCLSRSYSCVFCFFQSFPKFSKGGILEIAGEERPFLVWQKGAPRPHSAARLRRPHRLAGRRRAARDLNNVPRSTVDWDTSQADDWDTSQADDFRTRGEP